MPRSFLVKKRTGRYGAKLNEKLLNISVGQVYNKSRICCTEDDDALRPTNEVTPATVDENINLKPTRTNSLCFNDRSLFGGFKELSTPHTVPAVQDLSRSRTFRIVPDRILSYRTASEDASDQLKFVDHFRKGNNRLAQLNECYGASFDCVTGFIPFLPTTLAITRSQQSSPPLPTVFSRTPSPALPTVSSRTLSPPSPTVSSWTPSPPPPTVSSWTPSPPPPTVSSWTPSPPPPTGSSWTPSPPPPTVSSWTSSPPPPTVSSWTPSSPPPTSSSRTFSPLSTPSPHRSTFTGSPTSSNPACSMSPTSPLPFSASNWTTTSILFGSRDSSSDVDWCTSETGKNSITEQLSGHGSASEKDWTPPETARNFTAQRRSNSFQDGITIGYTYDAFFISDGRTRRSRPSPQTTQTTGNRLMTSPEQQQQYDVTRPSNNIDTHNRERYKCGECGKHYATSSNLSRHKQTHRSLESQQAKQCPHCRKVYVSMPALSMHVLTHDLKYPCGLCSKEFSRPWLLQGHLRSHSGEKPYGCTHCGRAFADRSNLRAHMQTHSVLKMYACTRCAKSFALKAYLNKHVESACGKDDEDSSCCSSSATSVCSV